jgi:hypothetical protein
MNKIQLLQSRKGGQNRRQQYAIHKKFSRLGISPGRLLGCSFFSPLIKKNARIFYYIRAPYYLISKIFKNKYPDLYETPNKNFNLLTSRGFALIVILFFYDHRIKRKTEQVDESNH